MFAFSGISKLFIKYSFFQLYEMLIQVKIGCWKNYYFVHFYYVHILIDIFYLQYPLHTSVFTLLFPLIFLCSDCTVTLKLLSVDRILYSSLNFVLSTCDTSYKICCTSLRNSLSKVDSYNTINTTWNEHVTCSLNVCLGNNTKVSFVPEL